MKFDNELDIKIKEYNINSKYDMIYQNDEGKFVLLQNSDHYKLYTFKNKKQMIQFIEDGTIVK